jgi:hypothetical protein
MSTGSETRFVHYQGYLTVDSAQISLPFRYGRSSFRIVVPITLFGNIEVHATDPFVNPNLLFQAPLSLQGTATLTLKTLYIDYLGRPVYQFMGVIYDFPSPTQTTEDKP